MNPKKIFICSTCHDLKDLRAELKNALQKWGYEPILSEYSGEFSVEVGVDSYTACVEAVKKSDMLILIVGKRYGGRVPDEDISITELEYNTAAENGIHRINFCSKEIWNLVQVWKENQDMKFPKDFKDGHEIMKFLDRIRKVEEGKTDNWIHLFETSVDIKEILKTQLGVKDSEVRIPKMDKVLKKEISKDARFFRPSGPEWIDFEEGIVVERKEVDEIIEKFGNNDLVVIKGEPASGKSVISRNVGFKLVSQGKDIHVIELKITPVERSEIFKLCPGYLFIDDAHLNLGYVDDIIRNLSDVKILVSTREIEEQYGPTSPLKIPEHIKDAVEIKGYDAANDIIQKFSEKRKNIPKNIKRKLTKSNLWILAWELEAYEEYGKIDEDAVCKKVKDYIRKDLKNFGVMNAENVFLPLSVFYKYEIPLRTEFVKEFTEDEDIEKLIELNEINTLEENGFEYLILYHSEIAEVFLKTFRKFDGFGNKVKEKVDENWFEGLFHMYIQKFPEECVGVINGISLFGEYAKLIEYLAEENFNELRKSIEAEDNVGEIGRCIWNVGEISRLRDEMDGGLYIEGITYAREEVAEKLVNSLDLKNLKDKIEVEADIGKIRECIGSISCARGEVAEKLVNSLDLKNLKDKIEVEEDIGKIGWCIRNIAGGNEEVAGKLAKSLDLEKLKVKIWAEEDFGKIGECIGDISKASEEVAEKLIPVMKGRIEAKEDIGEIGRCIGEIAERNEEVAEKLVPVMKGKIEVEKDIEKIKECICEIALESEISFWYLFSWDDVPGNDSRRLIEFLEDNLEVEWVENAEIKKSDNGKTITVTNGKTSLIFKLNEGENKVKLEISGRDTYEYVLKEKNGKLNIYQKSFGIGEINERNEEFVENIVENLDLEKLKCKIDAEEDVEKIGLFISEIVKRNFAVARTLVKSLDLEKLKTEIDAEEDIEKIVLCINGIANGSWEVKEIDAVSGEVKEIADGSEEIAEKLVKSLDLEKLKVKIEAEEHVGEVGWCIENIANGSEEFASKLIAQLDPKNAKTPAVREKIIELKKQYLK